LLLLFRSSVNHGDDGSDVMENTIAAEYLIAALIAMVVVVTFRRQTNKVIEVAVWISLVWVCVLAVSGTRDPQARTLTTALAWAAGQIVSTIVALSWQGALRWIGAARFAIADVVVVLFALDLFVLALVRTKRQANSWIPVTRLGEWMVLPRLGVTQPEPVVISAVDGINRRLNVWGAAAAAAIMTWSTIFFVRLRDVEIPSAARVLTNLAFAAGVAWRRVAAGRPQVGQVRISRTALDSTDAAPRAVRSKRRVGAKAAPLGQDDVDINQPARRVRARKAVPGSGQARAGATPRTPESDPRNTALPS
jgi:hypothetical protein